MLQNQVNISSLEIQQARIKFILFKSKVRSMLYGNATDQSVLSPRENTLGQWIYQTAQPKFGQLPEFRELEKLNLEITRQAQELNSLYRRGNIEEARTGLSSLDKAEKNLIMLLTLVEQKLGLS